MQERTLSRSRFCGDNLKALFRGTSSCQVCWGKIKMAMGLSHAFETRNRKRSLQAVKFMRTKASGYPSWPESLTPLKAEYIGADQLSFFVFRLQLCGGPYIPITRLTRSCWPIETPQ
jgi:hypothetical protein